MSLTDRFGRRHTYLRLGLTERCNLRCTYCMPASGVPLTPRDAHLTTDEIERLARLFVATGVETIRLTGGEPLVRKDAVEVARRLGRLGLRRLAITTNGLLLADRLGDLAAAGVDAITISLDTLRADRFREITRRPGLDRVLAALEATLAAGYAIGTARSVKVNVVSMRGVNEDEAADFAELAAAEPVEVRFIEEMPFAGNGWTPGAVVTMAETRAAIEAVHGPLAPVAARPTATAQLFDRPGWRGRVGFVASMSTPFCGTCDRLRVTADGALKVCLFGKTEVSLRDALRAGASDAEVLAMVQASLAGKAAAHAGLDGLAAQAVRPMVRIGG
ncbi:GTP 3',8-cyclase MoaA [Rubrivirga sp. IMCC45206]|uniref:GTP 3',8-cyclase MoaA n=1 Tax=Rubrivirga sp. IMCC45206 TaxID=3391614 RepID=UPI00398FAF47